MESGPQKPINPSHEDIQKMDALSEGVRDILYERTSEDFSLILKQIGEAFNSAESAKEIFTIIPEKLKWEDGKIRAMMDVLYHALEEFYIFSIPPSADMDKKKKIIVSNERDILIDIIRDDFGSDIMIAVIPLVDAFLKKASKILLEKRGLNKSGLN
jgi:hypothetical protein